MKCFLSMCFAFVLVASQMAPIQAMPAAPSAGVAEGKQRAVIFPDAVSLLNQLTIPSASNALGMNAVNFMQDDTTPPRIVFLPPALTLFPPPILFPPIPDIGDIVGISFDDEFPFLVVFGAASAFGFLDVAVLDLVTFFEIRQIQLPTGEIALGVGYIAAARFAGYYDPFNPICPCGGLEMFVVDAAGNTSQSLAPVVVVSF